MKYNVILVAVNIVWLIVTFVGSTIVQVMAYHDVDEIIEDKDVQQPIGLFVVSAIMTSLLIYPHAGFIAEVKMRIMSEETYPREEFSCCCIQNR